MVSLTFANHLEVELVEKEINELVFFASFLKKSNNPMREVEKRFTPLLLCFSEHNTYLPILKYYYLQTTLRDQN